MKIFYKDSSLQLNRGSKNKWGNNNSGKAEGIMVYTGDFNQLLAMCTLLTT